MDDNNNSVPNVFTGVSTFEFASMHSLKLNFFVFGLGDLFLII